MILDPQVGLQCLTLTLYNWNRTNQIKGRYQSLEIPRAKVHFSWKGPACRDDARSIVRSVLFIVLLRRHTETCKRFTTEIRKRLRSIEDRVVRSIISRMQHPLSSNMRTYRS